MGVAEGEERGREGREGKKEYGENGGEYSSAFAWLPKQPHKSFRSPMVKVEVRVLMVLMGGSIGSSKLFRQYSRLFQGCYNTFVQNGTICRKDEGKVEERVGGVFYILRCTALLWI
jgi:hypothetical protein